MDKKLVVKTEFSKTFYDFFESADLSNKIMLEFGSGIHSTPYYAERFKTVYSFENNLEWMEKVNQELSQKNIKNVNIRSLDNRLIFDKSFEQLIKTADYFSIDHNPKFISREYFSIFIGEMCKDDAFIILDNGDLNPKAYDYLKSKFYSLDFIEFGDNENYDDKLTSIFYYKR